MTRPVWVGVAVALMLAIAGCTATDRSGTHTPAPTSTVQVSEPTASGTPAPDAPTSEPQSTPTDTAKPVHGEVEPTATNEPTDSAYLSVKEISSKFVAAYYDFGYPDGYARDHLDKVQPFMTDQFFYEQLDLLEDAGANADPTWQQITSAQSRSVVEIGTVLPGYVKDSKAVSRVEVRIAIVAADSVGRTEGVPEAASQQCALLTFAKVTGLWKVDRSELVQYKDESCPRDPRRKHTPPIPRHQAYATPTNVRSFN